ncbi:MULTISPECIES: hypothetical protein [Bacillus cereus group]|uniref:hypothetical protein n=1 Tax=Bacillus cereus group TaxID=86661 RepID=UPI001E56E0A7|nr:MULTISPECIES: hypothetical protein [Bacillus cereus group]MCC2517814.1 hypothetical protein [Bacillus paranthracis]MDG1626446.1 hypothetical protein [Bacillus paranthracis]MDX5745227.1 hypothetical protein [Bacillus cereus group sp. BfR-BA-02570]MDX5754471.1 hypothetical protein [Bacillus cereus group sp. BfR-BA-02679]MDX5767446.1 hypothetical protein [Bacillus cereus group sp. BfR-BA-02675]
MVTQENYKEVYGDMEIKRIDRECYVTLKKYEGILHKCKVGFLFVFILFFIFCFSYKEVQVGPHSFEEVFSWKLIIGALVARIIFSYVSRYLIYIMVESVYKNRIKENQVKKNSDSFTILGVIKASIILILSPDLSAAKFFKNKFHEFVKNNKDKLHEHSNFEGEDLLLKAEGQDSVQGKDLLLKAEGQDSVQGKDLLLKAEGQDSVQGKDPLLKAEGQDSVQGEDPFLKAEGQDSVQGEDPLLKAESKGLCKTRSIDSETKNECGKNYIDKDDLCIQCNDSLKFMTKFHVKFSNWYNLVISIFLAVAVIFIGIHGNYSYPKGIIYTLFILLLLRLVSRTIEIAKAFYDDVVQVGVRIYNKKNEKVYLHDWKNTYIRKPLRISLAIHSLLELVLMFTCAYILTFIMFGNQIGFQDKESEKSFKHEMVTEVKSEQNITKVYIEKESSSSKINDYIVEGKVYEFFVYAVSICFFNISYINYGVPLWNILHVWQVTMSMVLIILCIAAYFGRSDDMYKRESEFFARTLEEVNGQNPTRENKKDSQ